MLFKTVTLDGRELRCDRELPAVAGVFLSIVPLAALFLSLQQFWRIDLISGGLKA